MHTQLINTLTTITRYAYNGVLNIIAPPFCAYCKVWLEQRNVFCVQCSASIKPVVSSHIQLTKKHAMKVFAIADYSEPLKSLILAKSRSNIIASKQLGQLMWERTYIVHHEFDIIVPVPLHWRRFAKRGFNQAEEIAKVIAHKSGKPIIHALKRVKHTPFQSHVKSSARVDNVKHAFVLTQHAQQLKSKRILFVDDVMTTGATLRVAARELLRAQPELITAVVACRVI